MTFISVNDTNFTEQVLNAKGVALVDFWAQWCGPCRQFLPIVEEVATEMKDKLSFFKVNVDEANSIPAKYKITGIPTIMMFKNGEIIANHSGSMSKKSLIDFINEHL